MANHETVKLGRRPANLSRVAAHPQARDVIDLSRLPSQPAARDWGLVDGEPLDYPMFRNDELGDCGIVSLAHTQISQSANSGVETAITDDDVVDGYSRLGGYVPGRPETDNGVNLLDVGLKLMGGEPLAGRKLLAIVSINPKDADMMDAAAEFFGNLWLGWDLPLAWQSSDGWDVAPDGSTSGRWAPRSWGGHATASTAYAPSLKGLISWSEYHPFTPAAQWTYCEEAYALIWEGLWTRLEGGLCPAGLDMQKLSDLMVAFKA